MTKYLLPLTMRQASIIWEAQRRALDEGTEHIVSVVSQLSRIDWSEEVMPALILTNEERRDLIVYLRAYKTKTKSAYARSQTTRMLEKLNRDMVIAYAE